MSTKDDVSDDVVWTPGSLHPKYKVIAAEQEGHWIPLPGYRWADDPPVISNVEWTPGTKHPEKNLVASETEGEWDVPSGYTRKN